MVIEHYLEAIIPYIAGVLEAVGVFIITLAAIKGLYIFIKNGFNFGDEHVAVDLAKGMSLSLSFLLAGEILHTILTKTIEGLIVLVGIAGLRVGLHYVLHWEIKSACKVYFYEEEEKAVKNM